MYRDTVSNTDVSQSVAPASKTGSANGTGVDLRGADSAQVIVNVGAIGGSGDMTITIEESDALASGYSTVAAADLEGSFSDPLLTATVEAVGYKGAKRYIRAVHTLNSGTSVTLGATVLRGHLGRAPTGA